MISTVNRNLKSARAMKGLRQADLAKRIGRSQSWLSQIEQGTLQPSEVDQALICRVLGASPDAIFPLFDGQIAGGFCADRDSNQKSSLETPEWR